MWERIKRAWKGIAAADLVLSLLQRALPGWIIVAILGAGAAMWGLITSLPAPVAFAVGVAVFSALGCLLFAYRIWRAVVANRKPVPEIRTFLDRDYVREGDKEDYVYLRLSKDPSVFVEQVLVRLEKLMVHEGTTSRCINAKHKMPFEARDGKRGVPFWFTGEEEYIALLVYHRASDRLRVDCETRPSFQQEVHDLPRTRRYEMEVSICSPDFPPQYVVLLFEWNGDFAATRSTMVLKKGTLQEIHRAR